MVIIISGEEAGPRSNKLGGIWNVIDAEAKNLEKIAEEEIIVAGPYFGRLGQDWSPNNRITDISDLAPPEDESVIDAINNSGIEAVAGKKDGIIYVLFNSESCLEKKVEYDGKEMRLSDAIKAEAFKLVGLDSLKYENTSYGREYTHYLNLSYAISEFAKKLSSMTKVSLHCHEFPVFYALARLEKLKLPVKTIATFHATKVGRAYGARTIENLVRGNACHPECIQHGLVKLEMLANHADVVTFVSDTTRSESRLYYGIDGIVIRNGIDLNSNIIDWNKKVENLNKMQSFISRYLDTVNGTKIPEEAILPVYTISRLELENKGYPDLLDSLVILERILRNRIENGEIDEVRVFCILITAHGPKDPKKLPEGFPVNLPDEILVGDELRLKRMIEDRELDYKNLKRKTVCALLYPQWVGRMDGGFNMTIDEIAAGCIAGIFPSRYEPFLLTALEACREACPVVISRACGFSGAVNELQKEKGIFGGVVLVDNVELTYLQTITDYAFGLHIIIDAFLRDKAKDKMMCNVAYMLAREMSWEEPVRDYYEILKG
jgi:hypothetical protein